MRAELLHAAADLARTRGCDAGCPSCAGPVQVIRNPGRPAAIHPTTG